MPRNKSPIAPNLWMQSTRTSSEQPTPATIAMVTHHLHPPRTAPTAHNSTQLAEQTVQHMPPVAPNVTRQDTGDQNVMVASHSNQGMHLHLGHSRGSPDDHLGTTTTARGRWQNRCHRGQQGPQPSRWDSPTLHPTQCDSWKHPSQRDNGQRCPCPMMQWGIHHHTAACKCQKKRTASLCIKVDTGAGGNVLPLRVFWCLYPDQISPAGLPIGLNHISTRLTTYNGSYIPLYGALCGLITW